MQEFDLTALLRSWPYEPGTINVRKIVGSDGRAKIQVRVDLGILQLELDGRPDGQRPHGFDSLLAWHEDRLARYIQANGSSLGYVITAEECAALREEAVQYYHRYVALFALKSFEAVIRDTCRNLRVIELCREFGETETDRTVLEQFRPQIVMMRARSEAELAVNAKQPKDAMAALDRGLGEIREIYEDAGMGDHFDEANEVQLLRGMRDVLVPKLPSSQRVELMERLRAALDAENYELAAILRDELRMM